MRVPFRIPFFFPWIYPDLLWRVRSPDQSIYLTFDDGPVPGPTEFVLNTLQEFKAQATFFCIGDNIRKHTEIFERIRQSHHAVGNHTFNHLKAWKTPDSVYCQNIEQCEQYLLMPNQQTNVKLFRPPYGQITRSKINLLHSYKIVMWDVLSQDYNSSISPERCLKGTISATRPGSIVVFHDSIKAERNLKFVLPRYIEHYTKQGFTFRVLG